MKIYAIQDKKNGMIYSTYRTKEEAENYLTEKAETKPWVFEFVKVAVIEQ